MRAQDLAPTDLIGTDSEDSTKAPRCPPGKPKKYPAGWSILQR